MSSAAAMAFSELLSSLDTPMFVVTVGAGGERSGCLVGFATQCSIHPPRFLACISVKNHTAPVMARATHAAVHVVGEDRRDLAELFGGETGDEIDKFTRCSWHDGPAGTPVLDGVEGWFVGKVLGSFDLGDHTGYLLEPIDAAVEDEEVDELGFQQARSIEAGHEP
jgi:flavin reductase (DIM6/NTAB) family NADH-FMN oxidoreductase RutF